MHMAAIAQVAIGRGRAEFGGEVLAGGEALRAGRPRRRSRSSRRTASRSSRRTACRSAGPRSWPIGPRRSRTWPTSSCALSLEATRGQPVDRRPGRPPPPSRSRARPSRPPDPRLPRPAAPAATGAAALGPGPALVPRRAAGPRRLPRVRRAPARRTSRSSWRRWTTTRWSTSPSGRMISNGNFHPIAMALAADALRPAIAHVGQLSDRRMNHLWPTLLERIDLIEPGGDARCDGASAARSSATPLRRGPRSFATWPARSRSTSAPLDLGVEDHATNAASAPAALGRARSSCSRTCSPIELILRLARSSPPASGVARRRARHEGRCRGARAGCARPAPCAPTSRRGFHAAVRAALHDTVLAATDGRRPRLTASPVPHHRAWNAREPDGDARAAPPRTVLTQARGRVAAVASLPSAARAQPVTQEPFHA